MVEQKNDSDDHTISSNAWYDRRDRRERRDRRGIEGFPYVTDGMYVSE